VCTRDSHPRTACAGGGVESASQRAPVLLMRSMSARGPLVDTVRHACVCAGPALWGAHTRLHSTAPRPLLRAAYPCARRSVSLSFCGVSLRPAARLKSFLAHNTARSSAHSTHLYPAEACPWPHTPHRRGDHQSHSRPKAPHPAHGTRRHQMVRDLVTARPCGCALSEACRHLQ
jgi:hypothetical protein